MSVLVQLALAGEGLWRALLQVRAGRLWVPWLALGALQAVLLLALPGFAHPALWPWLAPLVRGVGGEEALHYPGFFGALPALYARADLVLGALAGAVVAGWSTVLFAACWRGHDVAPGAAWASVAPRVVALVLALLPLQVLVVTLDVGLAQAVAGEGGLVRKLAQLVSLGGVAVARALFLYVPALVVLERRGIAGAFAALPRAWARGFWAALLLGAVRVAVTSPFQRLDRVGDLLVGRGSPELVGGLVLVRIVAELAVSFVLVGAATLAYLGAVAEAEPEARA